MENNYVIGNMVTGQDSIAALFGGLNAQEAEETPATEANEAPEEKETKETVAEVPKTAEELFDGKEPEGVGDDEDTTEDSEGEPSDDNRNGSSPEKLYSSIANSLAEDGALSNLSEEDIASIKDAESFVEAVKKNNEAQLDDMQRRVYDALNAGVEVSQIQQYEGIIQNLNNLDPAEIEDESEKGENLRRTLLYQYNLSLGLDQKKAAKMVERAFAGGTDVEDAKESLEYLKEHFQTEYATLIEAQKQQVMEQRRQQEEALKAFRKRMLEDDKILGDIAVDSKTRQKALDNWLKPTHRTEGGQYQSEIQKYISEHPADFQMKMALVYTITDGFKNMGGILKETVKKEKKKAMKDLEAVINNTQRTPSGLLDLKSNDPASFFNGKMIAPSDKW